MNDEQYRFVLKWAEALRFGEYKQGIKGLKSVDDSYCCLGVLCDIKNVSAEYNYLGYRYTFKNGNVSYSYIPDEYFVKWTGLPSYLQNILAEMNDSGESFHNIGNYLIIRAKEMLNGEQRIS